MRPRRCIVLRGTHDETPRDAALRVRALGDVVWAAPDAPAGARRVSPRALDGLLGRSVDAVVLDLHGGIDADAIARAEGLIRGGGALVLRMGATDPETRFGRRFARRLPVTTDDPVAPVDRITRGTDEQDAVARALADAFERGDGSVLVVVADRGRGKSAALGRAIAAAPGRRIRVTAATPDALGEVVRFAGAIAFTPPAELAQGTDAEVVVIDEAAQLPVALVKRIVLAHPRATIALATTCRGYEGTGRGFALRFLAWARTLPRPVVELTLSTPIRFGADDPLERWAFDALMLDAEPADLGERSPGPARHVVFDRDRLANDERTLRALFGLLVAAHYRTTPADLARLLDAPSLEVHALLEGDDVVAASLVSREGALPPEVARSMRLGERRIAGHALADTLVSHALREEAAALAMIRSVRIAVHEARRGLGLARRLVEAVHASHASDLFGTMFGATADLVRFRQKLGYEVVRLGVARGARSGEPSVVMIRPVSEAARTLVGALRAELSRELDAQLALIAADDGAPIEPALRAALEVGLAPATPLDARAIASVARAYAESTQPLDVVAASLARFVGTRDLSGLAPASRAVLTLRLRERRSWRDVAAGAGLPDVPSAMRAARDGIRALVAGTD